MKIREMIKQAIRSLTYPQKKRLLLFIHQLQEEKVPASFSREVAMQQIREGLQKDLTF